MTFQKSETLPPKKASKCTCPHCGYSEKYPKAAFVFPIIEKMNAEKTMGELHIQCPKCGKLFD